MNVAGEASQVRARGLCSSSKNALSILIDDDPWDRPAPQALDARCADRSADVHLPLQSPKPWRRGRAPCECITGIEARSREISAYIGIDSELLAHHHRHCLKAAGCEHDRSGVNDRGGPVSNVNSTPLIRPST